MANEKHDVASYYGVGKNVKVLKQEKDEFENPYQQINPERLDRLA
jgi:hypothetical protein